MTLRAEYETVHRVGMIEIAGLLSDAERRECLEALVTLAKETRTINGAARLLIDASDSSVQTRAISTTVDTSKFLASPADRLAVMTSGALHSMQTRRVLSDSRVRIFEDKCRALEWLNSRDPQRNKA